MMAGMYKYSGQLDVRGQMSSAAPPVIRQLVQKNFSNCPDHSSTVERTGALFSKSLSVFPSLAFWDSADLTAGLE